MLKQSKNLNENTSRENEIKNQIDKVYILVLLLQVEKMK